MENVWAFMIRIYNSGYVIFILYIIQGVLQPLVENELEIGITKLNRLEKK